MVQQTLSYCTPVVLISLKFSSYAPHPWVIIASLPSGVWGDATVWYGKWTRYWFCQGVKERMADGEKVKREHLEGDREEGCAEGLGCQMIQEIYTRSCWNLQLCLESGSKRFCRTNLSIWHQKQKNKKPCVLAHFFSLSLQMIEKTKCPVFACLKGCSTALDGDNLALLNPIIKGEELRAVFAFGV